MTNPKWRDLVDHVMAVPERIYEGWGGPGVGWNNLTPFGAEYGWNGVAWCCIFDWDMYHDMGLDDIVPKTAAVSIMYSWAQQHGMASDYPSIGAWVNFGNGAHTEIVVGFDETNVYTKGGNSVKDGATDNGQGNGVWSHSHARTSSYITGYFAPHFPDGVCPPTADPKDARGGSPVASWRWTPETSAVPPCPPFPGRQYFVLGAVNNYALMLQTWLARGNWGPKYRVGPSHTMAQIDLQKVAALQQHYINDLGPADGLTGPLTWQYAYETAYGLRAR